ncbi:DMT family transporter [Mangrovicoccus algicola]|uniref:DMT family transporter n=1 Tax=Mangrovicoccus algicola TaxID=2771008 RepID=A0A8J6Z0G7_9RHOB|nr:DMT family transporter [Mangrovicoccus algicola]MBE3640294.1 DMT family transporter [Mangrovicoccus algicola]
MQNAIPVVRSSPAAGIALMIAGVACLATNDALAKTLGQTYPPLQILFLRNLIALPVAVAVALAMGGRGALRSHRPGAHLLRGILWIAAAMLFFTALQHLALAEATALAFAAPLFITAISALFLGETVGWRRWSAVVAGFCGVLVAVRPGAAAFDPAALLPVATALVYAVLMLGARWVDPRDSVWTVLLYLTGAGALISALAVPFVWVALVPGDLWLFAAISLFGTAGMTLITQAFRLAPAAIVAPLDYTGLLWAVGLGWLIWAEMPDAATLAGGAIIAASGAVVILRGQRAGT